MLQYFLIFENISVSTLFSTMIFFSWSKEKSKQYAVLTKSLFESIFETDRLIWFSPASIDSGKIFMEDIIAGSGICDSVILFLTKENIYNPWIQFELGLFYGKNDCHIWPIFFDGPPSQNSTAFEHINMLTVNKDAFAKIISQIFSENASDIPVSREEALNRLNANWTSYYLKVLKINDPCSYVGESDIHDLVAKLNDECRLFSREGSIFRAESGFETHEFYKFVLDNTHKRLWVFGRKNKKLFDRGNAHYMASFRKSENDHFSLKVLFLDPCSEKQLLDSAQKKRNFKDSLNTCISDAVEILTDSGFDSDQTVRLYRKIRNDAIIISDNVVYFENVKYAEDLKPMHLTDSGFFMTTTETCVGKYYVDLFKEVWDDSYQLKALE